MIIQPIAVYRATTTLQTSNHQLGLALIFTICVIVYAFILSVVHSWLSNYYDDDDVFVFLIVIGILLPLLIVGIILL